MSGTTLVDTRTSPERTTSASRPHPAAPRTASLRPAEKLAASPARVRLAALTSRLLLVIGALAVVTAYALLPLAAALHTGAVLGGVALAVAAVVVVEAALAVALIVLKTEARH